jgi:hypothetical protein
MGGGTGSVPLIYTKCATLYYSQSIPLANESGSEGGRRRVAVGAPLRLGMLTLSEQWERRFPMVRGVREACSGAAGGFQ